MKILKILPIILLFVSIFSCDEIDNPLKERTNTCGEDDINPIRKILVEDYTGHTCGNCPKASRILHEIKNDYCEHIIPLAIHVGSFAVPDSAHGYLADYRTETGTELSEHFEISALPNGTVNRIEFNEKIVLGKNEWRQAVDVLFALPPDLTIKIESAYNETTKEISIKVTSESRTIIQEDINLTVYLAENNIISPQKDYEIPSPSYVENYVHNHLLRTAVTNTFGEKIASSLVAGDVVIKNYTIEAIAQKSGFKSVKFSVIYNFALYINYFLTSI